MPWAPKWRPSPKAGGGGRLSGAATSGICAKAKGGVAGRLAMVTMAWTLVWPEPAGLSSTSQTPIEPPWRRRRVRTSIGPSTRAAA
jgi:hypothetical protein